MLIEKGFNMNDKDQNLIWEAYINESTLGRDYVLPIASDSSVSGGHAGVVAFYDFHVLELALFYAGKLPEGPKKNKALPLIETAYTQCVTQLANRMEQYLIMAVLDEFAHLRDATLIGWVFQAGWEDEEIFLIPRSKFEEKLNEYASRPRISEGDHNEQGVNIKRLMSEYDIDDLYEVHKFVTMYEKEQEGRHGFNKPEENFEAMNDWEEGEDVKVWYDAYVNMGPALIERLMRDSENIIDWEEMYGKDSWADAVRAARKLNAARTISDKAILLDHIYDLQHHSGSLVNKSQLVKVDRLHQDYVAQAKDLTDLLFTGQEGWGPSHTAWPKDQQGKPYPPHYGAKKGSYKIRPNQKLPITPIVRSLAQMVVGQEPQPVNPDEPFIDPKHTETEWSPEQRPTGKGYDDEEIKTQGRQI